MKSPEQKDEAQRKVKKEIPRKWHRKVSQKTMSENYERKLLPSILSRQNVLTYRNTSYLKRLYLFTEIINSTNHPTPINFLQFKFNISIETNFTII